jgi:Uma2 family endonuclease
MQELPRRHRITVDHFYRMAEAGLFAEDERVELIEGEIIDVPPMGHHHAGVVGFLAELLISSLQSRAVVRPQLPLRLGEHSEPIPDIAVAKPREDRYLRAHPTADDVWIVVEVSSTTLKFDRNVKVPMCARHGVAEVWVLSVGDEQLHRYRSPQDGRYLAVTTEPLAMRLTLDAIGIDIDLRPLAALLALSKKPT